MTNQPEVPHAPINPDELLALQDQAGRPLTEAEADAYRRRLLVDEEVSRMLNR